MINKYFNYLNESLSNNINKVIDYTYLKTDANIDKIKQICNEAKEFNFCTVCIKPEYVSYANEFLKGSNVKVCTVISFPKGIDKPIEKYRESESAIINGADEIDVVMNYKLLKESSNIDDNEVKNNKLDKIRDELSKISRLCHGINSVILKVIIESGELTLEQVNLACNICVETGVDFVKTSTGFSKKGAEEDKVKFMRKILPDSVKIKASGGIRTLNDIERFVNAGADRIGTSSNPSLLGDIYN